MAALNELQNHHNKETSHQAVQLMNTLRTSDFVVCLLVLEKIMGYTLPLSKQLQATDTDLAKACLHVWKASFTSTKPKSALECLDLCDKILYPNIYTLLHILATLPVSTATPERTFSSLKRPKTYLRNTTSEN
ncbi:hypothetical protein HELRODRAFT_182816 [Helobdella robusta]|uniref:HAT C-terminal dimerisation domain-containing protein n=1 Tax=Helobdella robusta TaxID=6412 RepID=T1FIS8_HELRO|nr:hypothetical protein HELRODRAFT_182816 [Helobdella robusta]ESN90120.1 hypothetical protein HELRODRAFT_182816 [Helobdella robusta]